MTRNRQSSKVLLFIFLIALSSYTFANTDNSCPKVHVDGNIRSYYFARDYSLPSLADQHSFSLGGRINALTDAVNGFRLGATVYTAQPLGLNSKNIKKIDTTLPGTAVTALGQAFIQYENAIVLVRAGNQVINNPWINQDGSRMIDSTYQGLYININHTPYLNLSAMRLTRFKSRIYSNFTKTNLYIPTKISDGEPINSLANTTTSGALALGIQYNKDQLKAQVWGYQFYSFAKLVYGELIYKMQTNATIKPLFGIQLGREWDNFGQSKAAVYGAKLGLEIYDGSITIAYDQIPKKTGTYKNGLIVSPYTAGYTVDPLYTTSMIAGLIEKAAGSAVKATVQYTFFAKQLRLLASFARYNTAPFTPSTSETDFDIKYVPNGKYTNLSARYRIGILTHNQSYGRFVYHRVMLQYDFNLNSSKN